MVWPDVLTGEAGGKGRAGRFKAKEIPGGRETPNWSLQTRAGGLLVGTLGQLSLFSLSNTFWPAPPHLWTPCHWDSLEDPPKLCLDFWCPGMALGALLVAQTVKSLLAMQETQV